VSPREVFWEAVQAALDARRDPLEVPEVQRQLAEEPALLDELAALRSALELVERRKRLSIRSHAAAAALAAFALAGAWLVARREPPMLLSPYVAASGADVAVAEPRASEPAPIAAPAPGDLRVLAFRAEVTLHGPSGRRTASSDASGASARSWTSSSLPGPALQVHSLVAQASARSIPR
jgi:hypothetical protein